MVPSKINDDELPGTIITLETTVPLESVILLASDAPTIIVTVALALDLIRKNFPVRVPPLAGKETSVTDPERIIVSLAVEILPFEVNDRRFDVGILHDPVPSKKYEAVP